MKTEVERWTISKLIENRLNIYYPEFQREGTIWSLEKKNLLVDSVLRGFDTGSLYLVPEKDNQYACIDGRQRIAALLSFVGLNPEDKRHPSFKFNPVNEVLKEPSFADLHDVRFSDPEFSDHKKDLLNYELRIILLTQSHDEDETELNIQFERLQVAQILNSAEKLNAMVGDMRNLIFKKEDGLGSLPYFKVNGMRNERYGPQQSASQVAINVVSYSSKAEFQRARFFDMQIFFKEYFKMGEDLVSLMNELRKSAIEIGEIVVESTRKRIRNRALVVSVLLFYFLSGRNRDSPKADWTLLDSFVNHVIDNLREVSESKLDNMANPWVQLQHAITQASVETSAIRKRHEVLASEFQRFLSRSKPKKKG